jgi:hypothetical protein
MHCQQMSDFKAPSESLFKLISILNTMFIHIGCVLVVANCFLLFSLLFLTTAEFVSSVFC